MALSDLQSKVSKNGAWRAGVDDEDSGFGWAADPDAMSDEDVAPASRRGRAATSRAGRQGNSAVPPRAARPRMAQRAARPDLPDGEPDVGLDGQEGPDHPVGDPAGVPGGRTGKLVTEGRPTAPSPPRRGMPGPASWVSAARSRMTRRTLIVAVAGASLLIMVLAIVLPGSASWPASVATVKQEIQAACHNPNIPSDPGQVNFACGTTTSQVLWVFALLDSKDNPRYANPATGREGLEPITPAQGGEVAWALNLHHPYSALTATDSLAVAARAINNIIGGATITGSGGKQQVEPGLESSAANCQRYTGSTALVTREGFPAVCAKPVTAAGAVTLVGDVYRQWMPSATASEVSDVKTLFANADNPGDPAVQSILHKLAL